MRATDLIRFARDAATGSPLRTSLLILAMAIGVAAVVVLTALADGARRYVLNQFSAIGSNLVIVLPGRSQTGGFNPGNAITSTPRDLTIDDAQALLRASAVHRVAPLAVGTSEISVGGKLREVMVAGTTAEFIAVRVAPSAFSRPISAVRWVTETSITFITRMPATARLMAAMPATATVSVPRRRSKVARTAS